LLGVSGMRRIDRRDRAAFVAALLFAAAAVDNLVHLVTGTPFGELALPFSQLVALLNIVVWGVAAATLVLRWRSARVLRTSAGFAWVGLFLVFSHGLVLRGLLRLPEGIVFVVAAVPLAILVKRAFTPSPFRRRGPVLT
jgi:hypothetical protein